MTDHRERRLFGTSCLICLAAKGCFAAAKRRPSCHASALSHQRRQVALEERGVLDVRGVEVGHGAGELAIESAGWMT
jgi:hypothetical protein